MEPTKSKKDFHHLYKVKVKFNEVDMLQIVNNAVYLNYFEQAKIQYAMDSVLFLWKISSLRTMFIIWFTMRLII
jgi:acyl-CoA thioesterase FadM